MVAKTSSVNLPSKTVVERGLVSNSVKWKDVVSNYQLYSSAQKDSQTLSDVEIVLGYVTPVRPLGLVSIVVQMQTGKPPVLL